MNIFIYVCMGCRTALSSNLIKLFKNCGLLIIPGNKQELTTFCNIANDKSIQQSIVRLLKRDRAETRILYQQDHFPLQIKTFNILS